MASSVVAGTYNRRDRCEFPGRMTSGNHVESSDWRSHRGPAIAATLDGYTLLMGIISDVALAPLINATAKHQSTGLAPLPNIGTSGTVPIAPPDLPANNLSELLQLAKSKLGHISYGTSSTGSLLCGTSVHSQALELEDASPSLHCSICG